MNQIAADGLAAENLSVIEPELQPGERVLWVGRSRSGLMLRPHDVVLIPLGIAWCVLLASMQREFVAYALTAPVSQQVLMLVVDTLFIVLGVYIMLGRFFVDRLLREHTVYAVTDRRMLWVRTWPWRATLSQQLAGVSVVFAPHKDGSESIIVAQKSKKMFSSKLILPGVTMKLVPIMEHVDNAAPAKEILLRAMGVK